MGFFSSPEDKKIILVKLVKAVLSLLSWDRDVLSLIYCQFLNEEIGQYFNGFLPLQEMPMSLIPLSGSKAFNLRNFHHPLIQKGHESCHRKTILTMVFFLRITVNSCLPGTSSHLYLFNFIYYQANSQYVGTCPFIKFIGINQ